MSHAMRGKCDRHWIVFWIHLSHMFAKPPNHSSFSLSFRFRSLTLGVLLSLSGLSCQGMELIEDDIETLKQFYEFENLIEECNKTTTPDKEYSKWIIRFELDEETMFNKNITMDDINFAIKNSYSDEINCVFSDFNSSKLIFRIRFQDSKKKKSSTLDQTDEIYILKGLQEKLLNNIVLRGTDKISKVILRKVQNEVKYEDTKYVNDEYWVLDTIGTNLLDVLGLKYINPYETISNNIFEV